VHLGTLGRGVGMEQEDRPVELLTMIRLVSPSSKLFVGHNPSGLARHSTSLVSSMYMRSSLSFPDLIEAIDNAHRHLDRLPLLVREAQ
jgi:hypothetical protein